MTAAAATREVSARWACGRMHMILIEISLSQFFPVHVTYSSLSISLPVIWWLFFRKNQLGFVDQQGARWREGEKKRKGLPSLQARRSVACPCQDPWADGEGCCYCASERAERTNERHMQNPYFFLSLAHRFFSGLVTFGQNSSGGKGAMSQNTFHGAAAAG